MVRLLAHQRLLLAAREHQGCVNGPSDRDREQEMIDLFPLCPPWCSLLSLCLLAVEPAAALVYPPSPSPPIFSSQLLKVELSQQGS